MRLRYLGYAHDAIYVAAIITAVFIGMMFTYSIRQAEKRGEVMGQAIAYRGMSLKQLSELDI